MRLRHLSPADVCDRPVNLTCERIKEVRPRRGSPGSASSSRPSARPKAWSTSIAKALLLKAPIIAVLREQEGGMKTTDGCRKHGISSATLSAWKAKYGGMDVSQARKLKVLEEEMVVPPTHCGLQDVAEHLEAGDDRHVGPAPNGGFDVVQDDIQAGDGLGAQAASLAGPSPATLAITSAI